MKKLIVILIFISCNSLLKSQVLGDIRTDMETVKFELDKINIVDSLFLADIDSLVIPLLLNDGNCDYANNGSYYYPLNFFKEEGIVYVFIKQSKYPGRKYMDSIGYLEYKGMHFYCFR